MEKQLQSFHSRCARHITGQHIRQNKDETWTCPATAEAFEKIWFRDNTGIDFTAPQLNHDICKEFFNVLKMHRIESTLDKSQTTNLVEFSKVVI